MCGRVYPRRHLYADCRDCPAAGRDDEGKSVCSMPRKTQKDWENIPGLHRSRLDIRAGQGTASRDDPGKDPVRKTAGEYSRLVAGEVMDMNAQAGGGSPPNLFRRGFSNVSGETTADDLKSEGEIPSWVHGSYITNGPAIFDLKGYSFSHWFDGLAMLVSFSFSGARVGYASRFVKSDDYKDYAEKGTVSSITFATAGR